MRKSIATLAVLLSLATSIRAQIDSVEAARFYPANKDLGVSLNVSGLISNMQIKTRGDYRAVNSVFIRSKINEHFTFRLGIAPAVMNFRQLSTDSVGKDLVKYDSTARQSYVSLRPGLEWHITGTQRLDPYIALDGEAGAISSFNSRASKNVSDTTGTANYVRTINEAGGYALGAKLSLGMNYFVAKKLAIGIEYGFGVQYLSTGGDRQEVLQYQPVSGSSITNRTLGSGRVNTFNFNVDPTAQFMISYFFGL